MLYYLFHYYDESTGPFKSLSTVDPYEADRILNDIRMQKKGFASQRGSDYLTVRRKLEAKAREAFIQKGGKPARLYPHYMTLGECPWLLSWYERGKQLSIPMSELKSESISFTYGDLFPTMRYSDGRKYRGQVYTLPEIKEIIQQFGLPQQWNPEGKLGPERYIEVQVWTDIHLSINASNTDGSSEKC